MVDRARATSEIIQYPTILYEHDYNNYKYALMVYDEILVTEVSYLNALENLKVIETELNSLMKKRGYDEINLDPAIETAKGVIKIINEMFGRSADDHNGLLNLLPKRTEAPDEYINKIATLDVRKLFSYINDNFYNESLIKLTYYLPKEHIDNLYEIMTSQKVEGGLFDPDF